MPSLRQWMKPTTNDNDCPARRVAIEGSFDGPATCNLEDFIQLKLKTEMNPFHSGSAYYVLSRTASFCYLTSQVRRVNV